MIVFRSAMVHGLGSGADHRDGSLGSSARPCWVGRGIAHRLVVLWRRGFGGLSLILGIGCRVLGRETCQRNPASSSPSTIGLGKRWRCRT